MAEARKAIRLPKEQDQYDDCDTEPEDWSGNPLPCYQDLSDDLPEGMRTPSSVGGWEDLQADLQAFVAKSLPENDSEQSGEDFELLRLQQELERLQEENTLIKKTRLESELARLEYENTLLRQGLVQPDSSFGWTNPGVMTYFVPMPMTMQHTPMQQAVLDHHMPAETTPQLHFPSTNTRQSVSAHKADADNRKKQPSKKKGSKHQETDDFTMPLEQRTTVMLRNLPNNYTRSMVMQLLDDNGFKAKYDFLYLPMDFQSQACLGYVFVNLVDSTLVPHFWRTFTGFRSWSLPSRKVCHVSWSIPHQGYETHVERYRNSPMMHANVPDEHRPAVFKDGIMISFPAPTKTPRAPRVRVLKDFQPHWSTSIAGGHTSSSTS
jgi:hypothetical protein